MNLFKKYQVKVEMPQTIEIEKLTYLNEVSVNKGNGNSYEVKFKNLPIAFKINVVGKYAIVVPKTRQELPTMSKQSEDNLWHWFQAFEETDLKTIIQKAEKLIYFYPNFRSQQAV